MRRSEVVNLLCKALMIASTSCWWWHSIIVVIMDGFVSMLIPFLLNSKTTHYSLFKNWGGKNTCPSLSFSYTFHTRHKPLRRFFPKTQQQQQQQQQPNTKPLFQVFKKKLPKSTRTVFLLHHSKSRFSTLTKASKDYKQSLDPILQDQQASHLNFSLEFGFIIFSRPANNSVSVSVSVSPLTPRKEIILLFTISETKNPPRRTASMYKNSSCNVEDPLK
jgi:hypothetical protein